MEITSATDRRRTHRYSPQLNPVEHLWDELREKSFPNLVFHDLDALEDHLVDALADLEEDRAKVRSIAGFDWLLRIPLTASQYDSR